MEEVPLVGGSDPLTGVPERAEPRPVGKPEPPRHVSDEQRPIPGPGTPSSSPSSPCASTPSSSPSSPCARALPQHHSLPGSAVSALQSKVKALSERRAAWRERDGRVVLVTGSGQPQRVSASVLVPPAAGKWQSSSSDEEAEYHVQANTYLSNYPLPGGLEALGEVAGGGGCEVGPIGGLPFLSRGLGEGASLENLTEVSCVLPEEPLSAKPWAPPKGFWKAARPETLLLNGDALLEGDRPPGGLAVGMAAQTKAWAAGGLQRSDSLESQLHRCVQTEAGLVAPLGGLWRADSWESVCSSGSSLSLAERVEMNRGILKQMLSRPMIKEPEGTRGMGSEHRAEDMTECNDRGLMALNDSDWDSGISLQDSEHSQRAFVLSDDLPLSPRHEQAKRLLERARMKARAYPLKADHTILPVQRENP